MKDSMVICSVCKERVSPATVSLICDRCHSRGVSIKTGRTMRALLDRAAETLRELDADGFPGLDPHPLPSSNALRLYEEIRVWINQYDELTTDPDAAPLEV